MKFGGRDLHVVLFGLAEFCENRSSESCVTRTGINAVKRHGISKVKRYAVTQLVKVLRRKVAGSISGGVIGIFL